MTSSTEDRRARSSVPAAPRTAPALRTSVRLARTMRCATVDSGTRNARAISSVVSPPSSRSVSATRASVESTGWQAVKISRRQIVAERVVDRAAVEVATVAASCASSASRPSSSVLARRASRRDAGRSRDASPWPSATRPDCPGRPTRATARARRRARPEPDPRRARRRAPARATPAISRADSIRQHAPRSCA